MVSPLHIELLVNVGTDIDEMWDLAALAEDCEADAVYEFFVSAAPPQLPP
ncbi:MAG: hypothetical protein QOG28_750 [Trebonia sp.]|jgi:hypothetical protein|nr:hypothetical protein [Trebonia sp.]